MLSLYLFLSDGNPRPSSQTHYSLPSRMLPSKTYPSLDKIPEYDPFPELSDQKLRGVEACKKHKKLYRPTIPQESTIRSLQPMQRQWDHFWSEAIQIEGNQAKRHILMASCFKKAILSLKEYGEKNNLTKEIHHLYVQLLHEYYEDQFDDKSMEYLETLMFYTLHNLKLNIFIGCTHWNGGINDTLCRIQNTEKSLLTSINESKTVREIKRHIKNWQDENILIKKPFKDAEYKHIRIDIQEMILSMTGIHEDALSLKIIKKDLTEHIQSIIDSLALDVSQAQNDEIRKWQNSVFPKLHSDLEKLTEKPSLDQAETAFRDILRTNENGARFLGLDLSELDKEEPSAVHFFQNAITSSR
jgi:hypothetical protein